MTSFCKVTFFLAAVAFTSAAFVGRPGDPRDLSSLDQFLDVLKQKDPIKYEQLNVTFKNDYFKSELVLKNLELSGFSKLSKAKLDFTKSPVGFVGDFALDRVQLNSAYELKNLEVFKALNVQGKGDLQVFFDDVKLTFGSRVVRSFFGAPQLRDLKIYATLSTDVKVTGINGDEEQSAEISKKVTDLINENLDAYLQPVLDKLAPFIEGYVNLMLGVSNFNSNKLPPFVNFEKYDWESCMLDVNYCDPEYEM